MAIRGIPHSSFGKESACNAGVPGSIPGSGRSPGEGNSYPLQYSGLEKSVDGIVHGDAKSQTPLSDFHFHFPGTPQQGREEGTSTSHTVLVANRSPFVCS